MSKYSARRRRAAVADNPVVAQILNELRRLRECAGLTAAELDERLIFGPGWVERFESGDTVPSVDVLTVMLDAVGADLHTLVARLTPTDDVGETTSAVERFIWAEETTGEATELDVHFRYAAFDARYRLPGATLEDFDQVVITLRDGLAKLVHEDGGTETQQIKTNAVAAAFLRAVDLWPDANPSDLWWFVVSRAYLDPFNHPARFARLDLGQSWKRTGGWALEEVVVDRYAPALAEQGIRIFIAHGGEKAHFLGHLETDNRLEADKADVLLVGDTDDGPVCFGVVHVKASFAERRTDDVPMSAALVEAGYCSPLWTLDCKSTPSMTPYNKGELGVALGDTEDRRSAKRKDVEEDGYFSACFSYNANTIPTPNAQLAAARVEVCNFNTPRDDPFSRFVRAAWETFSS